MVIRDGGVSAHACGRRRAGWRREKKRKSGCRKGVVCEGSVGRCRPLFGIAKMEGGSLTLKLGVRCHSRYGLSKSGKMRVDEGGLASCRMAGEGRVCSGGRPKKNVCSYEKGAQSSQKVLWRLVNDGRSKDEIVPSSGTRAREGRNGAGLIIVYFAQTREKKRQAII